jgi:hypothetical protein
MAAADKFVYAAARLQRAKRYAFANSSLHPLMTCTPAVKFVRHRLDAELWRYIL